MPTTKKDDQLESISNSLKRIAGVAEFFKIFTIVMLIISIFIAFFWGISIGIASLDSSNNSTKSSSSQYR